MALCIPVLSAIMLSVFMLSIGDYLNVMLTGEYRGTTITYWLNDQLTFAHMSLCPANIKYDTCCAQIRIFRLIRLEGREAGGRALHLERGRLVDPAMVFDEAADVVRYLRRQRDVKDHDRLA